jgi:hypothetical protein
VVDPATRIVDTDTWVTLTVTLAVAMDETVTVRVTPPETMVEMEGLGGAGVEGEGEGGRGVEGTAEDCDVDVPLVDVLKRYPSVVLASLMFQRAQYASPCKNAKGARG